MTQLTAHNLEKLNTFELYKHYSALNSSLDLISPESKELLLAEMEACAKLKSQKIDSIHYRMEAEDLKVEAGKRELARLRAQIKSHEAQINSMRHMLEELHRRGWTTDNKLYGLNYRFNISPLSEAIEVTSELDDWTPEQLDQFAMVEEVVKTTHYKSINGNNIIRTDEKVTTRQIPNPDAIHAAHQANQKLPDGVKIVQKYRVQTKRNIQVNDKK